MRFFTSSSRPRGDIPSSSMADIAFLLLIFFLVTTVFPRDQGLAIVLPQDEDPVQIPPGNLIQFVVQPTGQVEVHRGAAGIGETVPATRISGIWQEEVSRNDRLVAVVRTHPEAKYHAMIDVLDALLAARARRVSLQLLGGSTGG